MNDIKIVKALECCTAKPRALCKECPYFLGNGKCKLAALQRDTIDIINRQQAEIERLNKEVDRLSQIVLCHDGDVADAVKEFSALLVSKAKSTKERFLLEPLVESVMKETGYNDESET